MQIIDGKPVYSATDLVGFLACTHLTELERCRQQGLVEKPHRDDPELDIIIKRGYEHEQKYISRLRESGRDVHDISSERPEGADAARFYGTQAAAARAAIERGDDVIFQACFFDGTWLGFADFLLRVEDPDAPLGWSYEVADTKLAHSVKAGALLQICVYNEMLAAIQGVYPEKMHVALGGMKKETQEFRTADFRAYFRAVRQRFLDHVAGPSPSYPPPDSYPEPVEHCGVCSWDEICRARRRSDDHLSLVANITAKTRASLVEREVETRRGLAGLALPLAPPLEGTRAEVLARVHRQAQLQVQGEDEGRHIYELLPPHQTGDGALDTTKGLLALPEPSPGDLYLDLEGDPFIGDDGMDYLFGLLEPAETDQDGEPLFHAFWSRDAAGEVTEAGEKAAFEACIDRIMACLDADPNLHVYHYASYEPSHFGRLMGRYNTRQDEVDRLFRGDIMVDLYGVVRQGLLASVESYSIKKLEPFYDFEREVELRAAGDSIVEFEAWMQLGSHGEGVGQEILDQIEAYNRDDVVSTLKLHRWLEERRTELARGRGEALPRPQVKSGQPEDDLAEYLLRIKAVADPLTADIPADETERPWTDDERTRLLLANVLGWHRREQKPEWWAYYHQREMTPDEMIEAREPLAGLELIGVEDAAARTFRYRFPPQDFDIGDSPVEPESEKDFPVVETAKDRNEIVLRFKRGRDLDAHPAALIDKTVYRTTAQEQRLLDLGSYVLEHGLEGDGDYRADRDMLCRRTPRVIGHLDGEPLRHEDESAGEAARRLVQELDHSCLAIQGPPGSGKTWIGGRMILDLVAAGKTVGVTAGSHKVIGNLLDNVWEAQADHPAFSERRVRMRQKPGSRGDITCAYADPIGKAEDVAAAFTEGTVDVVGGTSWLWASDKLPLQAVDVLFIDEAGQFSLANALAVSAVAKSVVLLGDPQQLDQPIRGSHPPGAEGSALGHLLGAESVMPAARGLFMDKTWRLHPSICEYTSEVFYRSELRPEAGNEKQALFGVDLAQGEGIRFVAVDHAEARNDNRSIEEARVIADIVSRLLEGRSTWRDREEERASITPSDILVITPYNAQRMLIGAELAGRGEACASVSVGTVDKFQGQQAPVSIYSMATSRPEDAPRGMEFLYSLNRLNVATSRARCLTLVVASPALIAAQARTPRQMVLANALCRLDEVAREQSA